MVIKVFGGPLHSRLQGCQWRAVVLSRTWKGVYEAVAKAGFQDSSGYLRRMWSKTGNEAEIAAAQKAGSGVVMIRSTRVWNSDYRPAKEEDR
jgi:hypothetical protein